MYPAGYRIIYIEKEHRFVAIRWGNRIKQPCISPYAPTRPYQADPYQQPRYSDSVNAAKMDTISGLCDDL